MKALGGSYVKFFTCKQREKERVVWCSREIAPSRQESGFLGHQKRVIDGFSLRISFQHKCISSVSSASAQIHVENEDIQTRDLSDQPKTVHVRFKLNKECAFGQQFLIVGDDPVLGLWDPSDGVPLDWSEGHVWIAEMDIPIGKVIQYKFILKGNVGNILWQPGPDRVLETWETAKTITVSEDWHNPELQSIVEEEITSDLNEGPLIESEPLIVAENLKEPIPDEGSYANKNLGNANGHPMVAENIVTEDSGGQDLSFSDKGSDITSVTDQKDEETGVESNGNYLLSSKDETKLVSDKGVPVLVPGLVPTEETIEAAEVNQVEDIGVEINQVDDNSVEHKKHGPDQSKDVTPEPELKDEHVSASLLHSTLTITETMMKVEQEKVQQMHGREEQQQQMESNILESDMQWGRRTIQKFLANFGFI